MKGKQTSMKIFFPICAPLNYKFLARKVQRKLVRPMCNKEPNQVYLGQTLQARVLATPCPLFPHSCHHSFLNVLGEVMQ